MFTFKSLSALATAVLMSPAAFSGYISLFNIEGESNLSAQYVTYSALNDMLLDTNRLGVFTPNNFGAGVNIVGSSAFILPTVAVPEPGTLGMLLIGILGLLATIGRSYRTRSTGTGTLVMPNKKLQRTCGH